MSLSLKRHGDMTQVLRVSGSESSESEHMVLRQYPPLPFVSQGLLHFQSSTTLVTSDSTLFPLDAQWLVLFTCIKIPEAQYERNGFHVHSIAKTNKIQAQQKGELWSRGMGETTVGTP